MALHILYKKGIRKSIQFIFFYVLLNINLLPVFYFNLRLINHSKGMHISSPSNKKQCNHICIVNLQNSILMSPRLCSMMLNPFGSLFPFFYFISRSLFPCLAFTSLFTLFFTCFSVFSLPFPSSPHSGPFPSFGLLVNLLAWWFCAPWPTCALWPQQMLPITVRNMPSISPLILKRLKVHLSLPPSHSFPTDANLRPPTASIHWGH